MKNILDFLINASVWVAIAVTALVGVTYFNLEVVISDSLLYFVFFGTIFGYNFIKYFEKGQVDDLKNNRLNFGAKKIFKQFKKLTTLEKRTFLLSVISVLICVVLFFNLKIKTQLALIVPSVLTFCYAISLGYKTLRNISGIKIYVVALVWAVISVLLPVLESEIDFETDVWVLLLQRFVFVVVLILPFDIRDLSIDNKNLRTLPQNIGVRNTKLYGLLLLMLFLLLEFFKDELLDVNLIVMPFIFLIALLFLVLSKEKQSKYYSSFFVEGISVLWFILLLVL
ncbi:MAG: hypothetical protein HRT69_06425 [Flavobacteriaceae bacterium]|nr:hypothetical protein [Flavobacteriaceae bacterium]